MNSSNQTNLVLIGMPGAGKSTLGVLLAKALGKQFVDTDIELQTYLGCALQEYLDQHGYLALRDQEAHVLTLLDRNNCVIATGGSAVYSEPGMANLKKHGCCVYLQLGLEQLVSRLSNFDQRGIAAAPGTDLQSLYEQRTPLYEGYADIVANMNHMDVTKSMAYIVNAYQTYLDS